MTVAAGLKGLLAGQAPGCVLSSFRKALVVNHTVLNGPGGAELG